MLEMRRAADDVFRQNEMEKSLRRRNEADNVKNFLIDQYVSMEHSKYHRCYYIDIEILDCVFHHFIQK